jgi:formamidopyrimidine-DNA glycosylase
MPEYPDIVVYIEALEPRIVGHQLKRISIASPFLLRTATPPIAAVQGLKITQLRRLGKRICIGFETEMWLVLHLMIAGRLHWHDKPVKASKVRLATFDFDNGTLSLTEAGTQRRAALYVVQGEDQLAEMDPGGLEIFETDLKAFAAALQSANHTLKRSLTDPRLFSGIGNAYSDEILWEAKLSPVALTQKLTSAQVEQLFEATRLSLTKWAKLLRGEVKPKSAGIPAFPEKVTAFRPEMAVHGKFGEPCPRCGAKIQRIRYASNETNYCPGCQTGGKLLADRSLSRLLRADWPRTPDEFENLRKK